ncbi:hypothetical protein [uncultured Hymenobacter sp.]|uniref:hypothetical protein n=1 Tax=uncultured Hymenobacter sp. TaxID=170016 RepID=UPI0035C9B76C
MKRKSEVINARIQLNQEWSEVRTRLAEFPPRFHPSKTIELLDLCRASPVLRELKPLISLGRLCLTHNTAIEQLYAEGKQATNNDSPCLYFYEKRYVVSSYDNENQWPFENSLDAVHFVQRHPVNIPSLANHIVEIAPSTLQNITFDWLKATVHVELRSAKGPVFLHLSGVSWYEAVRSMPTGEVDSVAKIEYNQHRLLMRLSSGNTIAIVASGLEIERG